MWAIPRQKIVGRDQWGPAENMLKKPRTIVVGNTIKGDWLYFVLIDGYEDCIFWKGVGRTRLLYRWWDSYIRHYA